MISVAHERTASGLFIPRSNGFANRIIINTVGSGSLVLPSWATRAKVVLLGAGGSGGASIASGNLTGFIGVSAGGGGPYSMSLLNLEETGRSCNYVLGAGGVANARTSANTFQAGQDGAISSVVFGSRTMTANPGKGGLSQSTSSDSTLLLGGVGGTATGGDINFKGGDGGAFPDRANGGLAGIPGGGSSGRPNGPGRRGGQIIGGMGSGSYLGLPGSSWGTTHDILATDPSVISGTSGGTGVFGPGTRSRSVPGVYPGIGSEPPVAVANSSPPVHAYSRDNWWDLEDVEGAGAFNYTIGSLAGFTLSGPGAGGMGGSTLAVNNNTSAESVYRHGGFGGGGGGGHNTRDSGNTLGTLAWGGNGGFGAGGGGAIGLNTGSTAYPGKGGDAWLGIWFN